MGGKYPVGTVASFSCNDGFRRVGSSLRKCQTSGNWNQQTPTCSQSKKYIFTLKHYNFCSTDIFMFLQFSI